MTTLLAPAVNHEPSRREFLALLGTVGVLAGCSAPSPEPAAPPSASSPVDHEFGTFDVPADPRRVIVLEGRVDLDASLVLGLTPIGVGENAFGDDGAVAPHLNWDPIGVTEIGQMDNLNIEQVAGLRPDLIIGRSLNIDEAVSQLAAIAPLLPVYTNQPWQANLRQLAGWLGREQQADTAIGKYERERDAVAASHADRLSTVAVAVLQPSDDGDVRSSRTTDRSLFLQLQTLADLGGRQVAFIEQGLPTSDEAGSVDYSTERIGGLADAAAILVLEGSPGSSTVLDANPLWPRLPAVRDGRVLVGDGRLNQGSALAARECLRVLDKLYTMV